MHLCNKDSIWNIYKADNIYYSILSWLNAPTEFQNIVNEIFNPYSKFTIAYIDDVLIYSQSIDE